VTEFGTHLGHLHLDQLTCIHSRGESHLEMARWGCTVYGRNSAVCEIQAREAWVRQDLEARVVQLLVEGAKDQRAGGLEGRRVTERRNVGTWAGRG
jgi:hypothetical protein